jgi:hypothetical protein
MDGSIYFGNYTHAQSAWYSWVFDTSQLSVGFIYCRVMSQTDLNTQGQTVRNNLTNSWFYPVRGLVVTWYIKLLNELSSFYQIQFSAMTDNTMNTFFVSHAYSGGSQTSMTGLGWLDNFNLMEEFSYTLSLGQEKVFLMNKSILNFRFYFLFILMKKIINYLEIMRLIPCGRFLTERHHNLDLKTYIIG